MRELPDALALDKNLHTGHQAEIKRMERIVMAEQLGLNPKKFGFDKPFPGTTLNINNFGWVGIVFGIILIILAILFAIYVIPNESKTVDKSSTLIIEEEGIEVDVFITPPAETK